MKKKRFCCILTWAMMAMFFLIPAQPAKAVETTSENVNIKYQTHVQNIGWQKFVYDGQLSGTSGMSYRLEGIKIQLENPIPGMRIKYQTQVQNIGWQNAVYDGQFAGTSVQSLRLEAIKISLEGAPQGYHVQYQVHVQNIGWIDWVKDGDLAGTVGKSLRLEGIRIRIVKDGGALDNGLGVGYKTHVQSIGWQDTVYDGGLSGTQGQALRLESINISLRNAPAGMRIKYQTHVQNVGWQNWVYDGALSGTTGQALRLEGIKMALENAPADYHVIYQVHVQNIGWQDWVSDGAFAGTSGQSLNLEAIRIKIVDTTTMNTITTKTLNYVNYNISFSDMINNQMNSTPAMQMPNSSGVWEWRYAQIQNGQQGYFIIIDKLDTSGNVVLDANNNPVTEQKWFYSPEIYNTIKNELINNMDVSKIANDQQLMYQFLKLSYSDGVTADQLNAVFNVVKNGTHSVLENKGQVFIDAAKKSNINPIYLAAHAVLETGYGFSSLAQGITVNGVKVFNLFGILAYDDNPDVAASTFAASKGWDSIDKAIYGGANWISSSYINNSIYAQDTLYEMRWNPNNIWHQYATDVKWAKNQTFNIKKCFDLFPNAKLQFDIPVYKVQ